MIEAAYRGVIYPLYHMLKRDHVLERMAELDRQQWLSSDELETLQQRKLRRLLAHCVAHVPYYRDLMREADLAREDPVKSLRRLPVLTKDRIRRNEARLVSSDLSGNSLTPNSTSGSTGEALRFYTDARSISYRKASVIRSNGWTGWRLGEPEAKLWGAPMDESRATNLRGRLHGLVTRHTFLSSYDMTDSGIRSHIEKLLRAKPTLLVSYPGPLEQLALYCQKHGIRLPSLRAIISSAETLWPHQRATVQDALGVSIFNRYGCREVGDIAQECREMSGLHVSSDRIFLEVLDENGNTCPPGVEGELCVTDLNNYGMPLVRYAIGDRGAWSNATRCACGRGFPLLQAVSGRSLDLVRTPGGNRIGGTFWTLLFRSRPGVRQFQVIQETLEGIRVLIVPEPELSPETLAYFSSKIREKCGVAFRIDYEQMDQIPKTTSGKTRLIVSHIAEQPATVDRVESATGDLD